MVQQRLVTFEESGADADNEQKVSASNPLPITPRNRRINEGTQILASAARTANGTGSAVAVDDVGDHLTFQLDVTAAATEAGDTLDVEIQTTIDGTNWFPVVAFTQVLGNGGGRNVTWGKFPRLNRRPCSRRVHLFRPDRYGMFLASNIGRSGP